MVKIHSFHTRNISHLRKFLGGKSPFKWSISLVSKSPRVVVGYTWVIPSNVNPGLINPTNGCLIGKVP